ncbi:MAG: efflux RND transporter periplasmic adaptor subunit [Gemmatimonadaceae bacterium]
MTRTTHIAAALLAAIALTACSPDGSNENSDSAAAGTPAGGAITRWTDSTELFMEHPALVVGDTALVFAAHLTDLTDFRPLESGVVTFRFTPRAGGAPVTVVQQAPRRPGIYGPRPRFSAPGVYDLTILVSSPQAKDSIAVPGLRVYASAAEAPREEEGGSGGISFLKEQQWKTPGFRTAFADSGSVMATIEAAGSIGPAAGRHAEVTAPISGLVDPSGVASSPAPGQRVTRGQVLAVITPSLGESGSAIAEARARVRQAEDEYERAKRLVAAEAAPPRRLREAEIQLQAARETVRGFGGSAATGGRLAIRAPIGGVVASRSITPGSRVDAGATLFTIVDPSVVWLTVNVPAAQAHLVSTGSGASFQLEGSGERFTAGRAVSVGSVIDPQSRTLPLIFEVPNPNGLIRVGSTARVAVRTGRRVAGVVIPASAILDEDGRPIAYVQAAGETFEKRELTLGGEEGDRVLVLGGIAAGDRVVTGAAYQVRLASLSSSVPLEGHAH